MGVATSNITVRPAAWGGATAVICVSLSTVKLVAGWLPNNTVEAPVNPLPVMVTTVPPSIEPPPGLQLVMSGWGT
ncbi:hypothetical protein ASD94_06100 [Acidovorax sp. Root70]|nr:hypothetical protein ASD94_06100 [Acidovorax sp. Root70]